MARDFESLIVDPSLVDPSIDTSNLRTTTDTREELLAATPEFTGIQFDPTNINYLDDLYALYSGQLPMIPVTPAATTPDVGSTTDEGGGGSGTIGTGSGGQATGGGTQNPLTQMVTTPTGDTMTAKQAFTSDDAYSLPQSGFLASGAAGGASLADLDLDNIDLGNPTGDPRVVSEEQGLSGKPGMLGDTGGSMDQMSSTMPANLGDTGGSMDQMSGAQQESALSEAFRKGKEALDSGVQTISQVGQSIADSVKGTYNDLNRTVNVPGLGDIDVGKTLGGLAVNTLVGAPVSFVKAAIDQIPKSASQLEYEGYTASQKAAVDEAFGPGGSMEGYNAVSQFGKGAVESIKDRINDIKNRKAPQTDASKQKINDLEQDLGKITGGLGNIFSAPTNEGQSPKGSTTAGAVGLNTITGPNIDEEEGRPDDPSGSAVDFSAARTADNIAAATETLAGEYDAAVARGERTADSTITSAVNKAKAQIGMPQMLGDVGGSMDKGSTSSPGFSAPSQQGQSPRGSTTGGGGNSNGGGKGIVCTMMNEFYGFGSFRNKIWLEHSKGLAPEYQKGYHKIFLPLVRLSKTNKFLKKTLEHIAIHRTIDIRQESRGKVHLLGRAYRKILEPICYIVGKYGK